MMMDALFGPPARSFSFLACLVLALASGCGPSTPTEVAETRLSVGMPTGTSSDPGELTNAGIAPPELDDVDTQSGGDRSQGVEVIPKPRAERGTTSDPPVGAELVPTPQGSASGSEPDNPIAAPPSYTEWPGPDLTLVITGQQHGYLEPCGCTGLDRQKGGVARRYTFMEGLRGRGWELLPIDAGNQVRRFGRQAEIKLQQSSKALKAMGYRAVGFGPDDLRLGVGELLAVAAGEDPDDAMYVSANVVLIDPDLMPQYRIYRGRELFVGITTVLDPAALDVQPSEEILINPMVESLQAALDKIDAEFTHFKIVTFFGEEEAARKLMRDVPGFDLIVVAGGYGEPTFQAEDIEGSDCKLIVTGDKGMYAGLIGLYSRRPFKYARVALTHEFKDAPEMRQLMADYQNQLRDIGLSELGLKPIPHPSRRKFVGSAKCGECHTTAYDIWEGSRHFEATDHIVKPPKERGDVARHFDPECISCHVTGWNPQNYYPYLSGYLSLDDSAHLTGNGCENCHGPGLAHSEAEADGSTADQRLRDELREQMKLSLDDAHDKCLECHDLDNSPDFHEPDAFEDVYWPEIEHYGLD